MPADTHQQLHRLPKLDLHRHIEGSVSPSTLRELYFKSTGKLLPLSYFKRLLILDRHTGSLDEFLSRLATPYLKKYVHTVEDLLFVFDQAVADAAADNLNYLEIRFALSNFLGLDHQPETLIGKIAAKLDQASQEYGCLTKLIITLKRDDSLEVSEFVVKLARKLYQGKHIVGLDLAGNEHLFGNHLFVNLTRQIHSYDIPLVVHAGEASGPESVRSAILDLHAHRVSHGVRAVEDSATMALIREKNVLLEICPTSNLDTGLYSSYDQLPITTFIKQKVPFLICTDDPVTSGITLSSEVASLIDHGLLTLENYRRQLATALNHTFSPLPKSRLSTSRTPHFLEPVS